MALKFLYQIPNLPFFTIQTLKLEGVPTPHDTIRYGTHPDQKKKKKKKGSGSYVLNHPKNQKNQNG
jgi:hypothetical protein